MIIFLKIHAVRIEMTLDYYYACIIPRQFIIRDKINAELLTFVE